jgi:transcriptional regulator with XRE-family HTH domain
MAKNIPPDSSLESPQDRIAAKIAAAAKRLPAVEQALRQERAALEVAAAVAEIIEASGQSIEELRDIASNSGVSVLELQDILSASTEGKTSIVTLAIIASALGYRFGFSFAPKSMSILEATSYVKKPSHVVDEFAINYVRYKER